MRVADNELHAVQSSNNECTQERGPAIGRLARTRVVGPSIEYALRIITIRLIEETEDWSTERRYMDPDLLASLAVQESSTSVPKRR